MIKVYACYNLQEYPRVINFCCLDENNKYHWLVENIAYT